MHFIVHYELFWTSWLETLELSFKEVRNFFLACPKHYFLNFLLFFFLNLLISIIGTSYYFCHPHLTACFSDLQHALCTKGPLAVTPFSSVKV